MLRSLAANSLALMCFLQSLWGKSVEGKNSFLPILRKVDFHFHLNPPLIFGIHSSNLGFCLLILITEGVSHSEGVHCSARIKGAYAEQTELFLKQNAATFIAPQILLTRLQISIKSIEDGSWKLEQLKVDMEYAVNMLDTICRQNSRRTSDDKDIVPQMIQTLAVPEEVRDWIESTFTRSHSNSSKIHGRQKFRSVVNAIRIGIHVDRLHKEFASPSMQEVNSVIKDTIENWTFNVFQVNRLSHDHALKLVGFEIFKRMGYMSRFMIPASILETFLAQLEIGYRKYKNPYHNGIHAADVTQTTYVIMKLAALDDNLLPLDTFAAIFAALIHDFEHTGTTNNFHINTSSDLALLYNDHSVLENHHLSSAFRILRDPHANVLNSLSAEEYRQFRKLVIQMVLGTDMTLHFQHMTSLREVITLNKEPDKNKMLSFVLHCADISHPGKDWVSHERWVHLLLQEFFEQGDRESELHLPYSPLCDRSNTLVAQSQIGFIDLIVEPSMKLLGDYLTYYLQYYHNADYKDGNSVTFSGPWESCTTFNRQKWTKYHDEGDFTITKLTTLLQPSLELEDDAISIPLSHT